MIDQNRVTLALPSKGAIAEPTMNFLRDCGLRVDKPNPRQYTGSVPAIPGIDVLFQRVTDVVYKVADGTAQLGVTGLDVVREHPDEHLIVIHPDLKYGYCKLLVAVPEAWVDVESMTDLVDVALDFREQKRRNMRVATTYTHLARQYLHAQGIHHFTLVNAEGAIEAAPTIGYADIIIDLAQTGTTLRENHLKALADGVIVESQACLVGNAEALRTRPDVLAAAQTLLEYIDAALNGRSYYQITVNVRGGSPEDVARKVAANPLTRGLQGPTVAPIYSPNTAGGGGTLNVPDDVGGGGGGGGTNRDSGDNGDKRDNWYTITIIIPGDTLLAAVNHLRAIGGRQATAVPVRYVFLEQSATFARLCETLGV